MPGCLIRRGTLGRLEWCRVRRSREDSRSLTPAKIYSNIFQVVSVSAPMPVFTRGDRRCLYIHVPKTGGTSVEMALASVAQMSFKMPIPRVFKPSHRGGLPCTPQHFHSAILQTIFPSIADHFDCIVMTVRHPRERVESEYRYQAEGFGSGQPIVDMPPFPEWLDACLDAQTKNPFAFDNHFRPQHQFLVPGCRVFRQETGGVDNTVRHCAARLGVSEPITIGHHKVSQDCSRIDWPSPLRSRFLRFYEKDFEVFRYSDADF